MLIDRTQIKPFLFADRQALRAWFIKNHLILTEAFIGYYKKSAGKQSVRYPEAVEEALCFGWIDGVTYSLSEEVYCNRFTPRKPKSIWSAVNCNTMEKLIAEGMVAEAGLRAYEKRDREKIRNYSHELEQVSFTPAMLQQLTEDAEAWKYFSSSSPSYKKAATHWVMSAKQETTRMKRLSQLIADSRAGQKIKLLISPAQKQARPK